MIQRNMISCKIFVNGEKANQFNLQKLNLQGILQFPFF